MEAGNHLNVKLIDAGLGESPEKKTPFIKVVFQNQENESITHYLWLSDAARDRAIDTVIKLGFMGKKLSDLANSALTVDDLFGEPADRIDLVVEKEEYTNNDGEIKSRTVVKWVNIGSGGMPEFNHEKAKSVFDGEVFDGLLREKRRLSGEPKPKKEVTEKTEYTTNNEITQQEIPF